MMVYGISVGYHYAQKELAAFASKLTAWIKLLINLLQFHSLWATTTTLPRYYSEMNALFELKIFHLYILVSSRTTTEAHSLLRSMKDPEQSNLAPVVRLVAVNRSQMTHAAVPMLGLFHLQIVHRSRTL